jgi:hypothetical protein
VYFQIMNNTIRIFIETGKKKVFAGALDWPGWCRFGKDEISAQNALLAYGPRYQMILDKTTIDFQPAENLAQFHIEEHCDGDATTDFGAPACILECDDQSVTADEYQLWREFLLAGWKTLDEILLSAADRELRKGPRGGGRDQYKLVKHILEADQSYLRRLAWKHPLHPADNPGKALMNIHESLLSALEAAQNGSIPEKGPRGGLIWSPRFFIRRVTWHLLDHIWEIQDRLI